MDCFVVGHRALSHKKLTKRHVSGHIANLVDVEMAADDSDGYPQELYKTLVQTFSKEGDLVVDIGSENGKFCFYHLIQSHV